MNKARNFSVLMISLSRWAMVICLMSWLNSSQAQSRIPDFKATDLNGHEVHFMEDLKGRKALVGFAFSTGVQESLQTWIEPIYYEMIDTNSLGSMVYDNEVFLVICFNKSNAAFKEKVRKELIENVLPECYKNVVLTEADGADLVRQLQIKEKGLPHLYAVDKEGRIKHLTRGSYNERKFDELSSHLEIE